MAVITEVIGNEHDIDGKYGRDPLMLTSSQRASAHFAAETVAGRSVRISLPRGTELQDGDVLDIDGEWAIVVKAADEDLIFITPQEDPMLWWAACYQLGNLHRPARFLADGILTPYDPMALHMLRGFDIQVEQVRRPFVGRRFGAAQGHHHQDEPAPHSHSHGHDHGHHHDHHHGGGHGKGTG
jgi:urease accessory protein